MTLSSPVLNLIFWTSHLFLSMPIQWKLSPLPNPACTENSGLAKKEVASLAPLVTTALKVLWISNSLALLVLSTICKDNGIALFAHQETSAPSSLPRQPFALSANLTLTSVWTDACPAPSVTDAVLKVLWSLSPALPVNGKMNSVRQNASNVLKVTSVLTVPSSHLHAPMVNTTLPLALSLTKIASAAPPVATASKVPTSLGNAPQALSKSLLVRLNALTAPLALNAGCPVWFQLCLAQLAHSRWMVNAWSPLLAANPPLEASSPSSAKPVSSLTLVQLNARSAPLEPSAKWALPNQFCALPVSSKTKLALLPSPTAGSAMLVHSAPKVPQWN